MIPSISGASTWGGSLIGRAYGMGEGRKTGKNLARRQYDERGAVARRPAHYIEEEGWEPGAAENIQKHVKRA